MNFTELFLLFKEYLLLGISIAAVIVSLFIIAYYGIYKKILNGKKTIPPKKLLLYAMIICYLVVIAGAVFLSRGDGYNRRAVNLLPLTLYKEAWQLSTAVVWRNLILNIIAFIPFGILLPMLSERVKKLWKTLVAGCAFSVLIECIQYITAWGQFSTDDIINNTLGVLIGYGLIMAILAIKDTAKRRPLKIIGYLSPLLGTMVAFCAIIMAYQMQEFGSLPGVNDERQDMTNVAVSYTVNLSEEESLVTFYQSNSFSREESRNFADGFFKKLGASFSVEREPSVFYDESAYFYSNMNHILIVNYEGKTYKYIDFNSSAEPNSVLSEEQVYEILSDLGIHIPNGAKFYNDGDGWYSFSVDAVSVDQRFIGKLSCEILCDGTVREIDNSLIEYDSAFERKIISPKEAFICIAEGKFHYGNEFGEMQSVQIIAVKLEYRLDSKGFYRPIYMFNTLINGNDYTIIIPAA